MKTRLLIALAISCILLPSLAQSQSLTSLASLRVRYNSLKVRTEPVGELKAQLDILDAELVEAAQLGQTGEMRRLLAKGNVLLNGQTWSDVTEFSNSLVLRSDRVVVDPAESYAVRLEQIYRPAITINAPLSARVSLNRAPVSQGQGQGQGQGQAESVKAFGEFVGVSRDLRESPYFFDLDLTAVPDGNYLLQVEVAEGDRPLGTSQLQITVKQGLNALIARLEQGAAAAPAALQADILYPIDRMRQVNRGRLELRTFNPGDDFANAEAVLAAVTAGKDPFAARTGDFKRHYMLESANEIMPYRLYIPSSYDPNRGAPLIVALHGLGGTENSFFENYNADFPKLAEQHGYIVAAPLGYRVDGSYGWGLGNPPADPNVQFVQARSEEDVMQVLGLVQKHYKIDPQRIYLTGHSMGAIGTWKVAAKFPDVWAAIGMFAGAGTPATLSQMQHIPQYVVHGDADPTVSVEGSRSMVARMQELEMTRQYIEVPGGDHSNVVAPNFPGLFMFFDKYTKQ